MEWAKCLWKKNNFSCKPSCTSRHKHSGSQRPGGRNLSSSFHCKKSLNISLSRGANQPVGWSVGLAVGLSAGLSVMISFNGDWSRFHAHIGALVKYLFHLTSVWFNIGYIKFSLPWTHCVDTEFYRKMLVVSKSKIENSDFIQLQKLFWKSERQRVAHSFGAFCTLFLLRTILRMP